MTTSSARDDDRTREPADGNRDPADTAAAAPAGRDRTIRGAALLATVIALPITLLVAVLAFSTAQPGRAGRRADARPRPTPRAQSTAPVEMAAPALAARPATVCRALLSQLPATHPRPDPAAGHRRPGAERRVRRPGVTVACGGAEPAFAQHRRRLDGQPGLLVRWPSRPTRRCSPPSTGRRRHGAVPALLRAAVAVGRRPISEHDRRDGALRRRHPVRLPALTRSRAA